MPDFTTDRARGHKLLPDSVAKKIPDLMTHDGAGMDAPIAVKLFGPGRLTYFITEWDGRDEVYGYCLSSLGRDCDEWGYSSLTLLSEVSHPQFPNHPAIERDLHFDTGISVREALATA
ncbi:MAG: DUF2958 domain-containing protein [Thermoleophilaceae bacterium]|nr:DUF2958 domain-containing protein [Thermoleophilaceae bacterium]